MNKLVEEVKIWNTPILGAYLLWEFTKGYTDAHPFNDAPIALFHFLASAILTHKDLAYSISNKRANLQSYVRGFEESKKSDVLLSLQERVHHKKEYTLAAIDIAISEGLMVWDIETGKLYARELQKKPDRGFALRQPSKNQGKKARILGEWISKHEILEIESYLKVVF